MRIVLCLLKQSRNPETNDGRIEGTPSLIPPKKSRCAFNTGTNAETSCSLFVFCLSVNNGAVVFVADCFHKCNGDVVVVYVVQKQSLDGV